MTNRGLTFIGPFGQPVTGASTVTSRFLSRVQREGCDSPLDVQVIAYDRPPGAGAVLKVRARVRGSLRVTGAVLRRPGPVYFSVPGGSAVAGLLPALAVARLRGERIYAHHHSFAYARERTLLFGALFWLAGPMATHIVLCDRMAEQLKQRYGQMSTFVLSNLAFIDPGSGYSAPSSQLRGAKTVLGHLSNLAFEKGLETVLNAASELSRRGVAFQLLLAGPAASSAVEDRLIQALGEMSEIEWLGPLDEKQKISYFSRLDLFLFPSRYKNEAQPMVVLEAASHGVPTLATGIGCLPHESSVLVLAEGEDLAQAIVEFPLVRVDRSELRGVIVGEIERSRETLDRLVAAMMQN